MDATYASLCYRTAVVQQPRTVPHTLKFSKQGTHQGVDMEYFFCQTKGSSSIPQPKHARFIMTRRDMVAPNKLSIYTRSR